MAIPVQADAQDGPPPAVIEAHLHGRARIGGTGIEVWEVVRRYRAVGRDFARLRAAYHWLRPDQLRAALEYAERHPAAIDERLRREEAARIEDLWDAFPQTRPAQ